MALVQGQDACGFREAHSTGGVVVERAACEGDRTGTETGDRAGGVVHREDAGRVDQNRAGRAERADAAGTEDEGAVVDREAGDEAGAGHTERGGAGAHLRHRRDRAEGRGRQGGAASAHEAQSLRAANATRKTESRAAIRTDEGRGCKSDRAAFNDACTSGLQRTGGLDAPAGKIEGLCDGHASRETESRAAGADDRVACRGAECACVQNIHRALGDGEDAGP